MSDHRYSPEVEILSVNDTGRRRRGTDAQKVRIVEESFVRPHGSMAESARRHDIGRTLPVGWRHQYRYGELAGGTAPLRFMPVTPYAELRVNRRHWLAPTKVIQVTPGCYSPE